MPESRNVSSSSAATGNPNPIRIFQNALAGPSTSDARGAAINDYPLAIQGLLGGDLDSQPYMDVLSRPSLSIVTANTQAIAQRNAVQPSPQNSSFGGGLSSPYTLPRKAPAQYIQPSESMNFVPRLSGPTVPDYYVDDHGKGYFLKGDADGSRMVLDDRANTYWQQVWDETGKQEGYGADGQPGMGSLGSIGYSYAKLLHASPAWANFLGAAGSLADDAGAGVSDIEPFGYEKPGRFASYNAAYPNLKTDIVYPSRPPVQTIYAPRKPAPIPKVGQPMAEQIASPYFVRLDPLTGRGAMAIDTSGFSKDTTLNGGTRSARKFWKHWAKTYSHTLSNSNASQIKRGLSPVVDDVWTQSFPEHNEFMGEKLVHHHLDYGPNAIPLPEPLHRDQPGWGTWHPDHAGG